ncbi:MULTISPECIES: TetR/AcrR family transcriptional regulator [unclassified Mesorhizobium]|uniref:TetR/AcrR family transcriptional regulator n=1 Tax=unclassified Mesorhizobium TaxID=325217 RepID=UPI000BB06924|nr:MULTISPECIES: TetR/AcrR family transcriptional regulator [unclassified Mesorhizobium]PBB25261.1 TetR family transcriptional regulator [Mesorhizobium sp. WSM4304]PBB74859.1 TetR family transcriptional regulator [Mesorhizobium sp. WSM4308]
MGRKKSIDKDRILDAVEAVVASEGAACLTLEGVAKAAGISKGSVVYDFGSKQALLEAMVERAVARDNAFNEAAAAACDAEQNRTLQGRIAAAAEPFPDAFRAVALNISAALAQDRALRAAIQRNQNEVISRIREEAGDARGPMLAYLALEGLKLLEALDYHQWPEPDRSALLADIRWLAAMNPT